MKRLIEKEYYIASIGTDEQILNGTDDIRIVRYLGDYNGNPDFIVCDVFIESVTGLVEGRWEKARLIYRDDILRKAKPADLEQVQCRKLKDND